MNPAARSKAIKTQARALGFDVCGIAEAVEADPDDTLGAWLARGLHADMRWMEATRNMRQDVQKKLPGARSVIVTARNYYTPRPEGGEGGRVSCYAWGRDYHNVLRKPLRRLARFVDKLAPDSRSYCCIDTGPVMEKVWAAHAGVGWLGKNSLLLRTDLGSWMFLGIVLSTVELAPDTPVPDQCGRCRLCIDACPTDAIVEPKTVDANRCISFHTIENRGDIPEPIQRAMGDWAFGCDICQEVCPWNRKTPVTDEPDFHPRPGHSVLDITRIARMDDVAFREAYSGTPLMRAKRRGLQRNLEIVETNLGERG